MVPLFLATFSLASFAQKDAGVVLGDAASLDAGVVSDAGAKVKDVTIVETAPVVDEKKRLFEAERKARLEQVRKGEEQENQKLLQEIEEEYVKKQQASDSVDETQNAQLLEIEIAQSRAAARAAEALTLGERTSEGDALFEKVSDAQIKAMKEGVAALRAWRLSNATKDKRLIYKRVKSIMASKSHTPGATDDQINDSLAKLDFLFAQRLEQNELWFMIAESWHELAIENNEVRLALLNQNKLSSEKRADIIRLTPEHIDDFTSELGVLYGTFRFYGEERVKNLPDQPSEIAAKAPQYIFALAKSLGLFLFALWVWRQGVKLKAPLREAIASRFSRVKSARSFRSWWSVVEASMPSAFVMLAAYFIRNILVQVGPAPETRFISQVVIWVAFARFCSQLTHTTILQLVRGHLSITIQTRAKILRSVRIVLRYTIIVFFVLDEIFEPLGAYLLFRIVRWVTYFGYVPIFLWLVWSWRNEISAQVRQAWPEGRLAKRLGAESGAFERFFWCIPAAVWLGGNALAAIGHDFLLGFESTRRALSYVLRLRFERKTNPDDERASAEVHPAIEEAFGASAHVLKGQNIERVAFARSIEKCIANFPAETRGSGNSVLIRAEQGMGRTALVEKIASTVPKHLRAFHVLPERRVRRGGTLLMQLAKIIDPEFQGVNPGVDKIVAMLNEKPSVIFLDGLEFYFLRTIGGHDAIDTLFALITATTECTFWVATISNPAERYLQQVRGLRFGFYEHHEIKPWNEGELTDLIMRSVKRSSFEVSFQESGQRGIDAIAEAAQSVETKEGFMRLLWEFSRGNPTVAQSFWMRSLVLKENNSLSVKPYIAPSPDMLEDLSQAGRFVLSTCFLHHALSPRDFAQVLNMPRAEVESEISRGLSKGYFEESSTVPGTYKISVRWWEATVRFLKRKKLSM